MNKTIHQRMHAVMQDVQYIKKEQPTAKGMKYSWVKHDDVTAACRKSFLEHGILAVPSVEDSTIEQFSAMKYDTYAKKEVPVTAYLARVRISVRFINVDNAEDFIETTGWSGMGLDSQDKAVGKATSYAYKYCLLKTFALETGDDVESDQTTEYVKSTGGMKQFHAGALDDMFLGIRDKLKECKTLEQLQEIWESRSKEIMMQPPDNRAELESVKNERKLEFQVNFGESDVTRIATGQY